MEPKFNTSFIPKTPVVSSPNIAPVKRASKGYGVNVFSVVSTVFFIVTIAAYGSLFFYRNSLNDQITQAGNDINSARASLQVNEIQGLLDLNARMTASKGLLDKHVVLSQLLALMESLTVKNLRFTKLTYTNDSKPSLSMDVEAKTYNTLIGQQDIFSKNGFIQSPYFSGFTLGPNGNILTTFHSYILSDLLSYKKLIDSLPAQ